jgi:hypothetical protein
MQQLPKPRFQFGVRGWVAVTVGLAALAVIAFLAIGFLIIILPLMLLAPILFRFLPKPKFYRVDIPAEKPPATDGSVIEGDFKVIGDTSDRNSPP